MKFLENQNVVETYLAEPKSRVVTQFRKASIPDYNLWFFETIVWKMETDSPKFNLHKMFDSGADYDSAVIHHLSIVSNLVMGVDEAPPRRVTNGEP